MLIEKSEYYTEITYMKQFFKYTVIIVTSLLLLFVFVANFSATEYRYECKGSFKTADEQYEDDTIYLKLSDYRFWVKMWSGSDASLNIEVPNKHVDYYGHLEKVGDQLQIYDFDKNLKGNFSKLSKTLALQTYLGFFDGTCKRVKY